MIRVLLADDHVVLREGLKRLLSDHPDIKVVAEAADGDSVLAETAATRPDVVLLDISMPGPGVVEVLRQVKSASSPPAVLVLSMHSEDQYAVRTLRAGAAGYVSKRCSAKELVEAVRRVASGGTYVSQSLGERLAHALRSKAQGPAHAALSDREHEILCLAARGRTVKEIAAQLKLSPKTVSTHRSRMLEKLNLKTQAEAMSYAYHHGLVEDTADQNPQSGL